LGHPCGCRHSDGGGGVCRAALPVPQVGRVRLLLRQFWWLGRFGLLRRRGAHRLQAGNILRLRQVALIVLVMAGPRAAPFFNTG